jgi:ketosteroid isomerase-like protein
MFDNDTAEVIRRFNDAFRFHDPKALEPLVADDCTIENTTPAPEGRREEGKAACLAMWQGLATAPGTQFELEEVFVAGPRAVIRWRYRFGPGPADSVRGLNWMRVRGGQIVEAMGYVKGA